MEEESPQNSGWGKLGLKDSQQHNGGEREAQKPRPRVVGGRE